MELDNLINPDAPYVSNTLSEQSVLGGALSALNDTANLDSVQDDK